MRPTSRVVPRISITIRRARSGRQAARYKLRRRRGRIAVVARHREAVSLRNETARRSGPSSEVARTESHSECARLTVGLTIAHTIRRRQPRLLPGSDRGSPNPVPLEQTRCLGRRAPDSNRIRGRTGHIDCQSRGAPRAFTLRASDGTARLRVSIVAFSAVAPNCQQPKPYSHFFAKTSDSLSVKK